ncbi:CLIP domain-containing serine protease HP8-like [Vanessa cardui]|uniref:CLIP domain-containing serine protease HP8-like n=1 Tax=Vanessa cardui TaxID=171605 RepID=UPI001F13C754|nr:CLIP domain-containing serine protease HP8-like [Vanessa cardui]
MDGDFKNAARILFSSDTIAPFNDITLESLQEKHTLPYPTTVLPPPPTQNNFLQVKDEDTYAAIMSFSSGSASGIDGITPQHLKDLGILEKVALQAIEREAICCSSYSNIDIEISIESEQQDRSYNKSDPWSSRKVNQPSTNDNNNPLSINLSHNSGDEDNNKRGNNESSRPVPNIRYHRNLDLLPKDCGPIEGERIFGGNMTGLFEMPWMVLLAYDLARGILLSYGGTLITQWYVLTAAHCLSFLGSKRDLREVILGEYDTRKDPDCEMNEGGQFCAPSVRNVRIDSVIAHPGYNPVTLRNDIGLIRLAEPADFSLDSIKPICLPKTPELLPQNLEGLRGVVAGWGLTERGVQSPVLLNLDLSILSNSACHSVYNRSPHHIIYDTQLCAGCESGKDSCIGDSGGPLMYPGKNKGSGVRYIQRGIVSYGSKRCGVAGYPGVYTRVANYMDWILDNISD